MATAGGAAAMAATIANAVKASGAIVNVEQQEFVKILGMTKDPLVVMAKKKFLSTSYQYLLPYKGFVFFTETTEHILEVNSAQVISANKIWIPG